jgi:hypothetical protein
MLQHYGVSHGNCPAHALLLDHKSDLYLFVVSGLTMLHISKVHQMTHIDKAASEWLNARGLLEWQWS